MKNILQMVDVSSFSIIGEKVPLPGASCGRNACGIQLDGLNFDGRMTIDLASPLIHMLQGSPESMQPVLGNIMTPGEPARVGDICWEYHEAYWNPVGITMFS